MKNEKIVILEKINKSFTIGSDNYPVLKDISFSLDEGDYVAILGASGSGKSTLMNIIGCMDTLDRGTYLLEEKLINRCKDKELTQIRNEKIGFIFQNYHLIPQYNVLQNIILPLLIRGDSRAEATKEALNIIDLVGLTDRIKHKPSELSGGQQQRVSIARALITKPKLLLADEPTGALDSKTGDDILFLFDQLNKMGNTILMITHDEHVAKHANRILRLSDGILKEDREEEI
ncbi:ABC transporter ATP-binding protein [Vagococcus sp. DIV0080]|uniref:ABC transporter ATP-binding protein n=1 Tax=Candidatus Vagococcus giribetii TaxID=2230876 RepID=A0ABS3HP10_9ENTE|nr:ABC transporter ATP-binding protein [Vagococcus sp. DIV0080]MBO0475485.1 ABC transporter ATP-binding protein [Vagococcus sp. DIV0080]